MLRVWRPPPGAGNSICLLRRATGVPCPGCGMSRAFAHLARGEWREAVTDHPWAPLLVAELAAAWAAWGLTLTGAGWRPAPRTVNLLLIANVLGMGALWLGRLAAGTLPV